MRKITPLTYYTYRRQEIKSAGIAVTVILVSLLVLGTVYHRNHGRKSGDGEASAVTESSQEEDKTSSGRGIPGSEVRRHLESLTETDGYAVVVATGAFLTQRKTSEPQYIIFFLNASGMPQVLQADGTEYILAGINYGASLSDDVLKSIDESGGYYTLAGLLDEDVRVLYDNHSTDTRELVTLKKRFHAWDGNKMEIPDGERFRVSFIHDGSGDIIGCFYYPLT